MMRLLMVTLAGWTIAAGAALAQTVAPWIQPQLKDHTALYEKKVYQVGDNVYAAVGWDIANCIMIVGEEGVVIFDTGLDVAQSRLVMTEFRKVTDKPVKAVVYSHFHPDHINGVKAYTTSEDVAAGRVRIIAHDTLVANVQNQGGTIGPILGLRSAYSFGAALSGGDVKDMNSGLGPVATHAAPATFITPTETFSTKFDTTIAGVRFQFVHVPSEAPDEIAAYLPDSGILLSAEVVQDHTFPNIHTLRGASFRDPVKWFKSIDILRRYNARNMVLSHGPPVYGSDEVERVLRIYRDGIQYVHDQTVRYMNKGLTPDELAQAVKLPPHLAKVDPWMQEYYGTVSHSVREIYQGYLGWFQGDPARLDPVPPIESAKRHVALMGGRDKVLAAARKAYDDKDYQWSAELATYLIRIDRTDKDALKLKAADFRQLGYAQINTNWRNWYLMSAMELDGDLNDKTLQEINDGMRGAFASPDMVAALPASGFIEGMAVRLKAEDTLDVELSGAWVFPDVNQSFTLAIRRGVAEFSEGIKGTPDVTFTLDKTVFDRIIRGEKSFPVAVATGDIKVSGGPIDAVKYLTYFERPFATPVYLTVR